MIIQNAVLCKDGTIIKSGHVHDFMPHEDTFVDGGHEYIHRGGDFDEDLALTTLDSLENIRDKMVWGTYGIDGKQPLRHVKLINCESDHLRNIKNMLLVRINNGMATTYLTWIILAVVDLILKDRKD